VPAPVTEYQSGSADELDEDERLDDELLSELLELKLDELLELLQSASDELLDDELDLE
jgi:hypothetical protein